MKAIVRILSLAMVVALMGPAARAADNRFGGAVKDASGAAIAGAVVRVVSRSGFERVTTSGRDGTFAIEELPEGAYLVEVSAPGFRRSVLELGESRELEVTLEPAGVAEVVTVTAADAPQSDGEIAKALSVVSRDETEARGEIAVPEALTTVPGLRVQRQGGPGALTALRFRGLRSQDTSVLLDDLRVRDASDLYGSLLPFFEDLMLTDVERIEIVRGAGSTLYGTHATGGVINLIPTRGAGTPFVEATVEGGSLGTFRGRLFSSGGWERFDYSAGVDQYVVSDGVDGDDHYRNTAAAARAGFEIATGARLSGNFLVTDSRLGLNGNPYYSPFFAPVSTAARFEDAPNDPDDTRDGRLATGSLAFDHAVNGVWSYTARYSLTDTERVFESGAGADPAFAALVAPYAFDADFDGTPDVSGYGTSLFEGRVHTVDVRNRLAFGGRDLLTVGFEAERESYFQYFSGPFGSSRGAYNVYGIDYDFDGVNDASRDSQWAGAVFAFNQASLLDGRLQLGLGARYQWIRLGETEALLGEANMQRPAGGAPQTAPPSLAGFATQDAVTGDASIAYGFKATGTRLWAHVGNSFRAPSLYERFSNLTGRESLFRAGDPTLRPERAVSADGGIEQTVFGGRLRAGATFFYTRLQEQIAFASFFDPITFESTDPLGLGRFGGYVNTRGGLSRGVELEARTSPWRGSDFTASYTYTSSDVILPSRTVTESGRVLDAGLAWRASGVPEHLFAVQAIQRVNRLTVGFDLVAQSEHDSLLFEPAFFGSRLFTFDGYARADLSASYAVPVTDRVSVTLFGRVENLTDTEILENGIRVPGATGYGGLKLRF